jgi:hypothetical protein
MSKLRLIRKRDPSSPAKDPRPGLDGPKGIIFRACLRIAAWVFKYNPDSEIFVENVNFSDMPKDWDEVCKALGTPLVVNAANYSYTKRVRAYWTNFTLPLTTSLSPVASALSPIQTSAWTQVALCRDTRHMALTMFVPLGNHGKAIQTRPKPTPASLSG